MKNWIYYLLNGRRLRREEAARKEMEYQAYKEKTDRDLEEFCRNRDLRVVQIITDGSGEDATLICLTQDGRIFWRGMWESEYRWLPVVTPQSEEAAGFYSEGGKP